MFQYRQVLVRLRAGDTVREVARSGLMGRDKLAALRDVAQQHGWLDAATELPADEAIAAAVGPPRRASSTVSSAEPHRALVKAWLDAGVQGRAIHAALQREHAWRTSNRIVADWGKYLRDTTMAPPSWTASCTAASCWNSRAKATGSRKRLPASPPRPRHDRY